MIVMFIAIAITIAVTLWVAGIQRGEGMTQMNSYSLMHEGPAERRVYMGAVSNIGSCRIRWRGPQITEGVLPIEVLEALRQHLTAVQQTTAASEPNAKLLIHVVKAIEEYEGSDPTVGGELNDLIPKLDP